MGTTPTSSTTPTSQTSIKSLLDRLDEKPDEQVGLTGLRGRALSRSAQNLHLATSGGIVAVPIANIQEVTLLGDQPDMVHLLIRNPRQIQPLLKARPSNPIGGNGGSGSVEASVAQTVYGDNEFGPYQGVGVSTCTSYDTATISGVDGAPDATDDVEQNCHADDVFG
jgi:hypothetical protein